jgi:tryptophan synthase alpha chain
MNRLEASIAGLVERDECGLAPYITAGDGGLERTLATLHALEQAGAACVELGVPFSDPIADGPVLQAAAQRSLDAGTTLDGVLELVSRFRAGGGRLPILLFSYSNPLLHRGLENSAQALAQAGADGLLVPDLPVEEMSPWAAAARAEDLATVAFVTPTTSDARIVRAAELSRGFVYVIGRTGITGGHTELGPETQEFLARVAERCSLPLGVGFGIRNAQQVAALAEHATLAIVGSALVQHVHEAGERGLDPAGAAGEFLTALNARQV